MKKSKPYEKRVTLNISQDLYLEIKLRAVKSKKTMTKFVTDIFERYIKSVKEKP